MQRWHVARKFEIAAIKCIRQSARHLRVCVKSIFTTPRSNACGGRLDRKDPIREIEIENPRSSIEFWLTFDSDNEATTKSQIYTFDSTFDRYFRRLHEGLVATAGCYRCGSFEYYVEQLVHIFSNVLSFVPPSSLVE